MRYLIYVWSKSTVQPQKMPLSEYDDMEELLMTIENLISMKVRFEAVPVG
jgi:hypothetical protein